VDLGSGLDARQFASTGVPHRDYLEQSLRAFHDAIVHIVLNAMHENPAYTRQADVARTCSH
jgi:hypothetical protein